MVNKRKVGHNHELSACDYLEKKGYRIVEMNYRCRAGEIDIIAKDGKSYVFVEVKYRATAQAGHPLEAVTRGKQKNIVFVANFYIMQRRLPPDTPVRFDVIAILGDEIEHIENAFEAMLF